MSVNCASTKKCSSLLVQIVDAPLSVVWSIARRFDKPELYKRFASKTRLVAGDGSDTGSIREVEMVSGFLPAKVSIERLDTLDDNLHVISFSIIGGDHHLSNYHSTMLLVEKHDEPEKTVVMESYSVDVLEMSSIEDTSSFVESIIRWNLESLALRAEIMAYTAT